MVTGGGEVNRESNTSCENCGFENPHQMRFCGHCGASLIRNGSHEARSKIFDRNHSVRIPNAKSDHLSEIKSDDLMNVRRHVTVLFVDLCGYSTLAEKISDEDLYQILQQVINLFVDKVETYGGQVNQFLGDGILAFFGAANAQENHVEMALRAALDMVRGIDYLNRNPNRSHLFDLNIHIGVNTGPAILGVLGDDDTFEYTAIGDSVNLARRLEEVAPPGEIYVSQAIVDSAKVLFEFDRLPRIQLKGISQPPNCYLLLGERSDPGSIRGISGLTAKMVGREKELDLLLNSVRETEREKKGHFCLITGEAGIGKSRLLTELKKRVDCENINILEGASLTYRRSVPYWVFTEIFRNLISAEQNDGDEVLRNKLYSFLFNTLGAQASEDIPFFEILFSLEIKDPVVSRRIKQLDPQQIRQRVFLAVRDLFLTLAKTKPLLFIIDDLHWADDTSLDLILYLSDLVQNYPVFICLFSRPLDEKYMIRVMEQVRSRLGGNLVEINVQKLESNQVGELIVDLLNTSDLPESFKQKIADKSAGVPFYLEEIVRMLIDQQILVKVDGCWKYIVETDFEKLGVPNNLRDLILARFDQLPPYEKQILRIGSVLGRKIDYRLLQQVLDSAGEDNLRKSLELLVSGGFIIKEGVYPEYTFRHVLTSDAIYATLLLPERVLLHTKVAEAIEQTYFEQIDSHIEILAGHYLRSSKLEKAVYYLILAGERAARDFANDQARKHYEEAANLLKMVSHSFTDGLKIWSGLGDICCLTGEYTLARQYFQMASNTLPEGNASTMQVERASLQRRIATTHEREGEYELAKSRLSAARNCLADTSSPNAVEMARINNDYGWLCFLQGDFVEASTLLQKGLDLIDGTENLEVIASIQNRLGAVAFQEQKFDKATYWVRKSLSIRKEIGDAIGIARAYNNLGLLGLVSGSLREAEVNFIQGLQQLERIGDAEGITLAKINCGLVKSDRGEFEEAEKFLKDGVYSAIQIHHRFYEALAKMYLGHLFSKQEKFDEANNNLEESVQIFSELGALDQLTDAQIYLVENAIAEGDLALAETLLADLDHQVLDQLDKKRKSTGQYGRLLRLKAFISFARVLDDEGQIYLEESIKIFAESGEKLEYAVTLAELSRYHANHGNLDKAVTSLEEARLIFKQIGADGDLQQVNQLLDHLRSNKRIAVQYQHASPMKIQ